MIDENMNADGNQEYPTPSYRERSDGNAAAHSPPQMQSHHSHHQSDQANQSRGHPYGHQGKMVI